MENLHEQIKTYIPKLEYSIREYMRNPAKIGRAHV